MQIATNWLLNMRLWSHSRPEVQLYLIDEILQYFLEASSPGSITATIRKAISVPAIVDGLKAYTEDDVREKLIGLCIKAILCQVPHERKQKEQNAR